MAYERYALGLAVWIVYVLDRAADGFGPILPTARHLFYRQNRRVAITAVVVALLSEGVICFHLPVRTLQSGLLFAPVVAFYLARIHLMRKAEVDFFPKEVAVAVLFATGTVLPDVGLLDLQALLPPALLFALLCLLNCSVIQSRERERFESVSSQTDWNHMEWIVSNIRLIAMGVAIAADFGLFIGQDRQLYAGLVLSALALIWFDKIQRRFSTDQLRVLVDLPLLFPGLLLFQNLSHGL